MEFHQPKMDVQGTSPLFLAWDSLGCVFRMQAREFVLRTLSTVTQVAFMSVPGKGYRRPNGNKWKLK